MLQRLDRFVAVVEAIIITGTAAARIDFDRRSDHKNFSFGSRILIIRLT